MHNGAGLAHSYRVYQAQGMVAAQCDCSLDCALVRMTNRANTAHLGLDELALAVIERRIRFVSR
jgi:hypothetical protein